MCALLYIAWCGRLPSYQSVCCSAPSTYNVSLLYIACWFPSYQSVCCSAPSTYNVCMLYIACWLPSYQSVCCSAPSTYNVCMLYIACWLPSYQSVCCSAPSTYNVCMLYIACWLPSYQSVCCSAPSTYDDLVDLLDGHVTSDKLTIIHRVRACHHPSLAEGNGQKLEVTFVSILLIFFLMHFIIQEVIWQCQGFLN